MSQFLQSETVFAEVNSILIGRRGRALFPTVGAKNSLNASMAPPLQCPKTPGKFLLSQTVTHGLHAQ
jgi:hypothetical protein